VFLLLALHGERQARFGDRTRLAFFTGLSYCLDLIYALPVTPLGLVFYVDLLAPHVLLDNLSVLDHVLADPDLLLGHWALFHHGLLLVTG
jgi:hypothetical protein